MPCTLGGGKSQSRSRSQSKRSQSSKSKSQSSKSRSQSRSRRSSRKQKGGNVLEAAVVPFGLLAVQQWFGSRSRNNKTKKERK
jgi:hypothetical protein